MTDASKHPDYLLGHTERELDRLIRQSALYGDLTEYTLRCAGLAPGMHVLDVGCGAGDVSLLAAAIVGREGHVTGVDQNGGALELARTRAHRAGISNLAFEQGDILSLAYRGRFDAVIGRLVLPYLGDPVAGVRAFSGYLKPGGLIYFQEFALPRVSSLPKVDLMDEAVRVISETFAKANIPLYMGLQIPQLFQAAGLPVPSLLGMSRVETGPASPGYEYLAETVRSVLPLAEKLGVTTATALDVDTLADRMREETVAKGALLRMPELIAGWTRVAASRAS
jgi:ubiquinone/menaquinone biosynthesis C-methylase UbiE